MTITDFDTEISASRKLHGRLWKPEKCTKGIVITHSWRNSMDEPLCKKAAEYFYSKGYAVLQYRQPAHGSDEHMRDLSFRACVKYSVAAAQKLREETGVSKVYGFGISLGSSAVGFSPKGTYDGLILVSYLGVFDSKSSLMRYWDEIESKREELEKNGFVELTSSTGRGMFEMGAEFIQEKQTGAYLQEFLDNKVPSLLVQGTADSRYSKEMIEKYQAEHASILVIEGADHNVSDAKHRKEILEASFHFINSL